MILIKFFYFLKGYVIIRVYGKLVWRLVSLCAEKGIKLYNITSGEDVRFVLAVGDFFDFYLLAKECGVDLKIEKETGLYNIIHRYRKRIFFPVGALIFVLFFFISSMFLWDIRVETDGNLAETLVLEKLAEIGVKRGAFIKGLPDGQAMKEHLTDSFSNVPWAWVYIKGVRATVKIHEGVVPPVMVDVDEPCDIIASKAGFITDMFIKRGKGAVLPGNGVQAGELLISGMITVGKEDAVRTYDVHAEGTVMALTRYEETGKYSLFENRTEFTGRERITYEISFFSKTLHLFKKPCYKDCVTVETDILSTDKIGIKQYKCMETEITKVQIPEDWVVDFAKRDLSARVASKLGASAELLEEEYDIIKENDNITVKGVYSFKEDIGVTVPIK